MSNPILSRSPIAFGKYFAANCLSIFLPLRSEYGKALIKLIKDSEKRGV
jgi:hypothetical protein